jgi:hypothetical protein
MPTSKPKPKPKKLCQKEQSQRFKQTARELGCDESQGALDKAFEKIEPSKRTVPTKRRPA